MRGGCPGHRAEIVAARVALASAAIEDSPVKADDLRMGEYNLHTTNRDMNMSVLVFSHLGVKLAIVPRSKFRQQAPDEEMMPPPPPPPSQAPRPQNQQNQVTTP
jgi:magnesium chelatase subunit D